MEFEGNYVGLQWLITLKKKGKIIGIWNEIEDFAKKDYTVLCFDCINLSFYNDTFFVFKLSSFS